MYSVMQVSAHQQELAWVLEDAAQHEVDAVEAALAGAVSPHKVSFWVVALGAIMPHWLAT